MTDPKKPASATPCSCLRPGAGNAAECTAAESPTSHMRVWGDPCGCVCHSRVLARAEVMAAIAQALEGK